MKDFSNVIESSLTIADPETLVIDVHPPPELHLLIGVVNHLIKLCINVDSGILDLTNAQNIFHHCYHGGLDSNNSLK